MFRTIASRFKGAVSSAPAGISISTEDIVTAYRRVLGREPESAATVEAYVNSGVSLDHVYQILLNSDEYRICSAAAHEQTLRPAERASAYSVAATVMGELVVRRDDHVIGELLRASGDFQSAELTRAVAHLCEQGFLDRGSLGCFVDVGANVGTHTLHAIRNLAFRAAIAIEPNAENFRLLQANVILNAESESVTILHAAASGFHGRASLRLSPVNRGDHRIVGLESAGTHNENVWTVEDVQMTPLDDLLTAIDLGNSLIWIDTQGHEGSVLQGMTRTLAQGCRLAFEFWPYGLRENGTTVKALLDHLEGYQLRDLQTPRLDVLTPSALERMFATFVADESVDGSPHTMILASPEQQKIA